MARRCELKRGARPKRRRFVGGGTEHTRRRREQRKAKRFEEQFHSAAFVSWMKTLPCEVSGRLDPNPGENGYIQCAHAGKTRGAGADYTYCVPLWWDIHGDFDNQTAARFCEKHKRTKASIIARAPYYAAEWQRREAA